MDPEYAIIVKNKTRLEGLIARFNTKAQAKFYIESLSGDFRDYELEHDTFHRVLDGVQTNLSKVIKCKIVEREFLPSYIFSEKNIIVVVGQDGLVANTAKYSKGLPIIAINPDKNRYDGVLLPFDVDNFIEGVFSVFEDKLYANILQFAEAKLNDGQRLLAFSDLFIGPSSHTSARYIISYKNQKEEQSSSGIIISTAAGATGWLSSLFNMAFGLTHLLHEDLELKRPAIKSNQLLFAVREPFKSIRSKIGITAGEIQNSTKLFIESLMPSNGIIFSDGIESDFLEFNSGSTAEIGLAEEKAVLVLNRNTTSSS
ncbi:sugar kinase [Maribacter sp. 4G9]|uniref:sugar kinase n=1 Tax=Maribacter sp. 4G9 TaxID=1889777 RepID=UPI000C14DB1E|nr:sugar kinase [Maribacter sp. 4G9]PIB38408.1 sugar kinase [Maribacter sp. 4G9]